LEPEAARQDGGSPRLLIVDGDASSYAIACASVIAKVTDQNGAGADKREKFSPLVRLDTVNGAEPTMDRADGFDQLSSDPAHAAPFVASDW